MRSWTEKQETAINSQDGSVLVSAAAGSGKTAVLVERVIRRITDESKKCDADRLLIVTFTKAAAEEMRDRINSALEEKIRLEPQNSYLKRQQMLLPGSLICTIDSFCYSLVKENFNVLGITPDFRIADERETGLIEEKAVNDTLEEFYGEKREDFMRLAQMLFKGRDDRHLSDSIKLIYNCSTAYPFPEKWLELTARGYDPKIPISENPWGKEAINYALKAVRYCLSLSDDMLEIIHGASDYELSYMGAWQSDRTMLENIEERLAQGDWDGASRAASQDFERRGRLPNGMKDEPEAVFLELCRNEIKNTVRKKIIPAMCVSDEEHREDMEYLYPVMKALTDCVRVYSEKLRKEKDEKACYDFSDISHMALSLLVDENAQKTELAKALSERYAEILIDEYQDTNRAQDMLFEAVSRNGENLFRVGDVKQSIYSFRQAMPEIFIEYRESLPEFQGIYPGRITLDRNFRSREGVTELVNFVFSQLMSEQAGSTDYGENEKLVYSADYPDTDDPQAEFHVIDMESEELSGLDITEAQAEYVASLVKDIISSGRIIKGKDGQRPVQYRDICVLLRSGKTDGTVYAEKMRKWGIPCFTNENGSFFSAYEVAVMLSLLRVIDNPARDIPLMSVMMSPIFSFTPDEMAEIRIGDRKSDIYACLLKMEEKNEKVAAFLKFFRRMRYVAATSSASSLIRKIYDETLYPSIVLTMEDGERRRANLILLAQYAEEYEKNGIFGLSGFIRFVDRMCEAKKDFDISNPVSENADVVRIMTVHKSKGLEFPVCILAGTQKKINLSDERKNIITESHLGVGITRRNPELSCEYETLPHNTARLLRDKATKEEEMRILYVAMTRAREELILVTSIKGIYEKLNRLSFDIDMSKEKLEPFSVLSASSHSDLIIKALIRHPDCGELRKIAELRRVSVIPTKSRLKTVVVDKIPQYTEQFTCDTGSADIDNDFRKFIDERVNYKYKYAALAGIPTKRAASMMNKEFIDRENFASSKPAFLNDGQLSSAQKGTAMHLFMEKANFKSASEDLEKEIALLVSTGKLSETEAQSLDRRGLKMFLEGDICRRLCKSDTVWREKKFTVDLPAEKLYQIPSDIFGERVMIQGIIDCAFLENGRWVLLDYKTDRVKSPDILSERYYSQLLSYKYALEQMSPYKVECGYIYSFCLSESIKIF